MSLALRNRGPMEPWLYSTVQWRHSVDLPTLGHAELFRIRFRFIELTLDDGLRESVYFAPWLARVSHARLVSQHLK